MNNDILLFLSVLLGWRYLRIFYFDLEKRKGTAEKKWRLLEPYIQTQCQIFRQMATLINHQLKKDWQFSETEIALPAEQKNKKEWRINYGLCLENQLKENLKKLEALVEKNPHLMTQQLFLQCHQQLVCLEKYKNQRKQKFIQAALHYNKGFKIFPSNVIALVLRFKQIQSIDLKS